VPEYAVLAPKLTPARISPRASSLSLLVLPSIARILHSVGASFLLGDFCFSDCVRKPVSFSSCQFKRDLSFSSARCALVMIF
jgi:hypothetical protein